MHSTYKIHPVIVNGISSLVLGELNTKLSTFSVGFVLPFRSNTLLEEVVVGVGTKVVDLGDVVEGTILGNALLFEERSKVPMSHLSQSYLQKSSTVSTEIISFKLSAQEVALAFFPGLSNHNVQVF